MVSDSSLVSHASEHRDLRTFCNKKVLVVGSGQSALESAALLHEGGAEVEVIGRAKHINWLQLLGVHNTSVWRLGGLVKNLLYAPTDALGPQE